MKKHYAIALVNKLTDNIDHIATSNEPIDDDKIGKPQDWEATHNLVRFEFEAEPDTGSNIMRGRTALGEFSFKAGKVEPGTKAKKMIHGRDYVTQRSEFEAIRKLKKSDVKG